MRISARRLAQALDRFRQAQMHLTMMNVLLPLTFFGVFLFLSPPNLASIVNFAQARPNPIKQSSPLVIANIQNSGVVEGCGCYFHSLADGQKGAEKFIFMADVNEDAWMNINGKDVKLRFISSSPDTAQPKIGQRSFSQYKSGNLRVRVDYIVTGVCQPNDEQCESTSYNARISVVRGASRRIIEAKGGCGC
jgi:hypothetical protein